MFLLLETKLFVCLFVCLFVWFYFFIVFLSTLTGKKVTQTQLYNAANVKHNYALVHLGTEVPGPT